MTSFSLDLVSDLRQLVEYPFMVHALLAGTFVALLASSVGWYVVLRRQAFAAHSLSVMAFPGATGAALLGLPTAAGYYIACGLAAAVLGPTTGSARRAGESAAIGTFQAAGLGAGFLFLALGHSVLGGPESLLFGTFLGVSAGQVLTLALVTVAGLCALAAIWRPLALATLDPELARARGLPVRRLDTGFLLLLALAVAATSQITGALLVFALLAAPAAAAQRLTTHAARGLALSIGLGLAIVWLALAIAYFTTLPVGFLITTGGLLAYGSARLHR